MALDRPSWAQHSAWLNKFGTLFYSRFLFAIEEGVTVIESNTSPCFLPATTTFGSA
jgi:hypothetical protein